MDRIVRDTLLLTFRADKYTVNYILRAHAKASL